MRASNRSIPSGRAAWRGGPAASAAACCLLLCLGAVRAATAAGDAGDGGAPALTAADGAPTACGLQVTGLDRAGTPVLRTLALSLDRPGLLAAPLRQLRAAAGRWSMLRVVPDSGLPDSDPAPVEITGVIGLREDLDLAVLSAPGLRACPTPRRNPDARPTDDAAATGSADGDPPAARSGNHEPLEPFLGLRDRIGYRPRVFRVAIERAVRLPDGRDLLVTRIPDGGGAENGFLLDGRLRLAAVFLAPPVAADTRLACALPVTMEELSGPAGENRSALSLAALRSDGAPTAGDDAIGRFAAGLMLSRVDQIDRALGMLQESARGLGEFGGLLVERGTLQYRAGRTAEAIDDFMRAARLEPELHIAHYNLGIALGSVGRYDEAAAALEQAARIAPDHARTIFHLALAYQAAGRGGIRRQYESLAVIDAGLALELKTLLGLP